MRCEASEVTRHGSGGPGDQRCVEMMRPFQADKPGQCSGDIAEWPMPIGMVESTYGRTGVAASIPDHSGPTSRRRGVS